MTSRCIQPESFTWAALWLLLGAVPSGGSAAVVESIVRVEAAIAVAVDGAGNRYEGLSLGSPGAPAPLVGRKWAPDGTLIYETTLGVGLLWGMAVGASGNLFLVGATDHGIPEVRPIPGAAKGAPCGPLGYDRYLSCGDAFLVELDPSGRVVLASGLGGSRGQAASAVAVGPTGTVHVVGVTSSADFPSARLIGQGVVGAVACGVTFAGSSPCPHDAFVATIDPSGSAMLHSEVLAGSGSEYPNAIAVDAAGNSWITGYTDSSDFPMVNAFHAAGRGFLVKLDSSGTPLLSTYLGKTLVGSAVATSSSGDVLLAGYEDPGWASFLRILDGAGREVTTAEIEPSFAVSVSGDPMVVSSLAQDAAGDVYVAGYTKSIDLPIIDAVQGTNGGEMDAFVTKFSLSGAVLQSTYLGGSGSDAATSIAVDSAGGVYVAGFTSSSDFPLLDGPVPLPSGTGSGFLVRIGHGAGPAGLRWAPEMIDFTVTAGAPATKGVVITNASTSILDVGAIRVADAPGHSYPQYFSVSDDCGSALAPGADCTAQITFSPSSYGEIPGILEIGPGPGRPRLQLRGVALSEGHASMRLSPQTVVGRAAPGTAVKLGIVRAKSFGTEPLVITRVAPPAGFAAVSDCTGQLDPGKTCSIEIDFAPTTTGPISGVLAIESNDPWGGGVQDWILLEGVGEDFALTAGTAAATVSAGASATYSLAATGGGSGAELFVVLACGELPAGASCAFRESGLAVAEGSTMTTLTIGTSAAPSPSARSLAGLAGAALAGLALVVARPRRGRQSAWLILVSMLVYGACTHGAPSAPGGTPPGSYDVVVTGRAGTLARTTTLTLVVR